MKYLKIFFVLLSLLAIAYLSYDYSCQHMGENVFDHKYCPICDAYGSIVFVYVFLALIVLLHVLQQRYLTFKKESLFCKSFIKTIFSLRAPPVSPAFI